MQNFVQLVTCVKTKTYNKSRKKIHVYVYVEGKNAVQRCSQHFMRFLTRNNGYDIWTVFFIFRKNYTFVVHVLDEWD